MLEWLNEIIDEIQYGCYVAPGKAAEKFALWVIRVTRPRTPVYTPLYPMTQEEQDRVRREQD